MSNLEHHVSKKQTPFVARDFVFAALATLAVALVAVGLPAHAQETKNGAQTGSAKTVQGFAVKLRALYPATRIDEVYATATPGIFEVVMGPNVAYIDASGRYWTFGHRYDMVERRDLTAPRLAEAGKVDTSIFPVDAAIKTVKGNGKRVVYVFADPNCGYCKQLERSMSQLTDVTVYTYMLPILSQESVDKANAIWCSPVREDAWRAWMLDGVAPKSTPGCATPTSRVSEIAKRLRIEATPMLITADGRKAPGAMPAEELTAWLDAGNGGAARTASIKTQVLPN
jgi:thiol:disulfide interchange protein DsbC